MSNYAQTPGFVKTRKLAVIGLLAPISITMGLTGLGFIPTPLFKITIMHLPVIIAGIIEGPFVGGVVGLIFGLFSVYQNVTAPTVVSFVFMNPLVSVIPRILIGIIPYYMYKVVKIKSEPVRVGISAFIGSLTNTVGVLGMIYVLYAEPYAKAKELNPDTIFKTLATVAGTNGIIEAVAAVIIVTPVVLAVKRLYKK